MGKKNNKINCAEKVGSRSRAATIWNDQSIAVFCDLCIKEAQHHPGTHFSKLGWNNLVSNLSKETGKEYDKAQLKNKWDSLKAGWKMRKESTGKETCLGWDLSKNTIDASDEWWRGKIQGIKPDMEEKLDRMFMNTTTTSEHDESEEASKDVLIKLKGSSDPNQFIPVVTTQATRRSGRRKRRAVQQPDTQIRKKGKGVAIGGGKVGDTVKLSVKIDHLVESVGSSISVTYKAEEGVHGSGIPQVMQAVESLPGAEPGSELWWFATSLFISENKREMFAYIKDPNLKLQWLSMNLLKNKPRDALPL